MIVTASSTEFSQHCIARFIVQMCRQSSATSLLGPGELSGFPGQIDEAKGAHGYFSNHRKRIRYAEIWAQESCISSAVIEGVCKNTRFALKLKRRHLIMIAKKCRSALQSRFELNGRSRQCRSTDWFGMSGRHINPTTRMQQKCRKLGFWLCQFRQIPEQLPPDTSMLDVQQRIKCFSRRGGAACATEIGKQSDCELIASSLALENPIMRVSEQAELRHVNCSFLRTCAADRLRF